jgi:uracil-DNA glycosylase
MLKYLIKTPKPIGGAKALTAEENAEPSTKRMKISVATEEKNVKSNKTEECVIREERKVEMALKEINGEQKTTIEGDVSAQADLPVDVLPLFKGFLPKTALNPQWKSVLRDELSKPYMSSLFQQLLAMERKGAKIFPSKENIFSAFNYTPFENIRVVLIGQDPYHNDKQAHGLCFSVQKGIRPPPSLKNIYKELASEYPAFVEPNHGCLISWAKQGVFLLNATLTVEAHKANSHSTLGWQRFTDAVIKMVSQNSTNGVVFLLWGAFAHKKEDLIDKKKHRVIKTAHPSPLSYRKFQGCKCFGATNAALEALGRDPIDWTAI